MYCGIWLRFANLQLLIVLRRVLVVPILLPPRRRTPLQNCILASGPKALAANGQVPRRAVGRKSRICSAGRYRTSLPRTIISMIVLAVVTRILCARAAPKFTGHLDRIDTGLLPPCSLVACAMNSAVVDAAERHRKFIAGLTSERLWLHASKMMRIRWLAAADEASLLSHIAQMLPVAIPARCSKRKDTLVDASGLITSDAGRWWRFLRRRVWRFGTLARGNLVYSARREARQFLLKRAFEDFGIGRDEAVFGGERASGPRDHNIGGGKACDLGQKLIASSTAVVPLVAPRRRPFPDSRGGNRSRLGFGSCPAPDPQAVMSGASRSSSPAMPTSVNSA
jgi:hypothetical protein